VQVATFLSKTPLCHLIRALGELERAGFDLRDLLVTQQADGHGDPGPESETAYVQIGFTACGHMRPETYLARLAAMPGVFAVTAASLQDGTCP